MVKHQECGTSFQLSKCTFWVIKNLTEFYKSSSTKDGKTYSCKLCFKKYRDSNKEYNRLYMQTRRVLDREKINENKRQYWRNLDPRKKLYQRAKSKCKSKGIDFNLDLEDIIIPSICPYLKVPFVIGVQDRYEYTHSLDRIDNSKGYIKGNIEVISKKANSMKNSATNLELLNFALEIIKRKDEDIVRAI